MTIYLLILSAIINIVALAIMVILHENIKKIVRYIDVKNDTNNNINDGIDSIIDLDENNKKILEEIIAYIGKDEDDKMVQGNLSALIEEWRDKDNEENLTKVCKYDTFEDLNEFLEYISNTNIKVIDVANEKIRKVAKLDRRIYNGKETVIITFDNGYTSVFKPNLYARYDNNK